MRTFHLEFDLARGELLSSSGFKSAVARQGARHLEARTRIVSGGLEFFLWGRFYSFESEAALETWLRQFHGEHVPRWLAKADGDFVVVVFDSKTPRVHLLADRNGQYRTYVARCGSRLLISNSLRTMVRLLDNPRISNYGLYQLLTLQFVMDPYSLVESVEALQIGEIRTFDRAGSHITTYYRPVDAPSLPLRRPRECLEALDDAFRRVCAKRVAGKGTPCLLLSGGIDSLGILKYLSELAGKDLVTLNFSYETSDRNERNEARLAAGYSGCRHHELIIPSGRYSEYFIAGLVESDTLSFGGLTMKATQEYLAGLGSAFEVFGGIDTRLHTPSLDGTRRLGVWINAHFAHPRLAFEGSTGYYWPDFFLQRLLIKPSYTEYILSRFLRYRRPPESVRESDPYYARLVADFPRFEPSDTPEQLHKKTVEASYRCQYTDDMNYHVSGLESDAVGVHIPYCDHECVRLCNAIPYAISARRVLSLRTGRRFVPIVDKWVMRKLLMNGAPPELLYRRKGAHPQTQYLFNDASFRQLLDSILAHWLPDLLDRVDHVVMAMVAEAVGRYAARASFSWLDDRLLTTIGYIAAVTTLNQQCLKQSFDPAAALDDIRRAPKPLVFPVPEAIATMP